MAQTQARGPIPVETLGLELQPVADALRMPNVVPLPRRRGRNNDEHPSRPADVPPGGRMSGTASRAEILPMPLPLARADSSRGWVRAAPQRTRDEALEDEPGDEQRLLDDDFTAGSEADEASDGEDLAQAGAGQAQPVGAGAGLAELADDPTLAAWIERIAHQDERALELLYDATAARVHGVVLRIAQRTALAEEVVEETYWQVWRQAPRFDAARGRPITWLLAMARSRAIDMLRREQRFQHDELPDDDVADAAQAAPPPQDLLEATRGNAHVHAALASLEPRARQLVALAFFRGLTHEEIAEQQGMPLGTVKSLIRRALQQLKRVMEAEHA